MLQVRAYGQFNTKAIQVEYKASSLNSNDVFVICGESAEFYVWCGKGSTGDERETAKSIVLALKKEPQIVIESQEKEDFWAALGGLMPYHNEKAAKLIALIQNCAALRGLKHKWQAHSARGLPVLSGRFESK